MKICQVRNYMNSNLGWQEYVYYSTLETSPKYNFYILKERSSPLGKHFLKFSNSK